MDPKENNKVKNRKMLILKKIKRKLAQAISKESHIETYFNVPFKFYDPDEYFVNERIIEVPFVFSELKADKKLLKIFDFGCTRSWVALSLASMGHRVYGIDLRHYPFRHPNLVYRNQNILDFKEKGFDIAIALSSLEHVGLGAYGEDYHPGTLTKVIVKINELLVDGGRLILTVPAGKSSLDGFMRSFTPAEIEKLAAGAGFSLEKSRYFKRQNQQQWLPCSREDILEVSNRSTDGKNTRGGVNGLGCLVFTRGALFEKTAP
jgi:SAM-dependent methyltransferase